MRVLVAGATGAVGRPLVRRLRAAGHDVVGLCRTAESEARLAADGYESVRCDLADREATRAAVARAEPEVVVDQVTGLPSSFGSTRWSMASFYDRYVELAEGGRRELHRAAVEAGARRYVLQSVAFVYDPGGDGPRTEEAAVLRDPPSPWDRVLPALFELERQVLEGAPSGVVLRYGFFYGPGTNYAPGGRFFEDVRRGRYPLVGEARGQFSFIHVEDAAAAAVSAVERGTRVYNVVDDEPAPLADWLPHYARAIGAKPPRRVPRRLASLVAGPLVTYWATEQPPVSNRRAVRELGRELTRPSWRQGLAE